MILDLSDMDQHSFDIAQRFFTAKFPHAECAFVAGSLMRGEGKPHSDIDLVVLYGPDFMAVRREAHVFKGVLIDVFLHNEQAQDFFFDKDVRRGVCALLSMIVEGRVIGKDAALAEKRKRMAQALIEKGPPPLDESDLKRRRYFISDLLDDLRDDRPPGEVIGCLSGLFVLLGDFHLRAQNQWSGNGKGLIRSLRKLDADFAARYEQDFAKAFQGDLSPIEKLVVDVLQPYGGLFWDGHYDLAPDDWKNFGDAPISKLP